MKLTRLEARIRLIKNLNKLFVIFLAAAGGFVVVATAVPQHREMVKLEEKLEMAKQRESVVAADLEYHRIEHRALREDPTFLELQARDRLDYYRQGERILKFRDAQ